jgi:hypothetical protein
LFCFVLKMNDYLYIEIDVFFLNWTQLNISIFWVCVFLSFLFRMWQFWFDSVYSSMSFATILWLVCHWW